MLNIPHDFINIVIIQPEALLRHSATIGQLVGMMLDVPNDSTVFESISCLRRMRSNVRNGILGFAGEIVFETSPFASRHLNNRNPITDYVFGSLST